MHSAKIRSTGDKVGLRYGLDDGNITAQIAREGKLEVIDGRDGRFDPSIEPTDKDMTKVSYFIPVLRENRVLAVLATASKPEDKEQTLANIDMMQPLLNVAAIALEHARLYRELGESEAQLRQAQKMEAVDKGTGLGLSTVYGIALQHGGWVECDSLLGERTTFAVYLPITEQAIEQKTRPSSSALPRGSETVLIIDDEEEVRMVLEHALERFGYQVLAAAGGPEGLARYEAHRDDIALVVLDLSMPRMSGEEVLARVRASDPHLKVLVLSGHSVSSEQFAGQAEVLKKPLSIKALAHKVREILDQ